MSLLDNYSKVIKIIKENLDVTCSLDCTGISAKSKKDLQHFLAVRHKDTKTQALYESTMKCALESERTCPGAGIVFLKLLCGENLHENDAIVKNRDDLLKVVSSLNLSRRSYALLEQALLLSTSSTKLSVKKSSTTHAYVDVVDGYSFNVNPLYKTQSFDLKNAKIACIDGFIETVSEIHHLLTFLSASKEVCLIFARGMSDDVVHTLKVNYDRKTLLSYPYVVPFDLENVNTIVDIAVVSGTDVVSTTKGDLISSLDVNKLGSVENVLSTGHVVRFKNKQTRRRVKEHVDTLKKTIEERPEIEEILSRRLKSLTSSCIDIAIPDDINYLTVARELDEGIRVISSVINKTYAPVTVAREKLSAFKKSMETTSDECLLSID